MTGTESETETERAAIERLLAQGDAAGAETRLAAALAAAPDDGALWMLRGGAAAAAERWTDAVTHFTRATALMHDSPEAWFGLAHALSRTSGLGKAGVAAGRALKRGLAGAPADQARVWAAYGMFSQGQIEKARRLMASAAPTYAGLPAARLRDNITVRDAAACAVCARDIALAEHVFAARYPRSSRIAPLAIGSVMTTAAWCRTSGAAVTTITPAEDIAVEALSPYSRPWSYRTDPITFVSLPGGQWIPGWDFALTADGTVLGDTGYMPVTVPFRENPHFYFEPLQEIIYYAPARHEHIDSEVLLVSAPQSLHIGHWMIDFLPRLRGADLLGQPRPKIAVPANLGRKHRAMLALWGYGPDDLVECRTDTRYSFRMLHVFRPGQGTAPHPDMIAYVRRHLFAAGPNPPAKKIYLARSDSRLAANAAEFEALLAEEEFISIDLAEMPIAAQRETLAQAAVLLGAYGTNMLAVYFAPKGATVITMTDRSDEDLFMIPTCATLGLTHQILECPTAGPSAALRNRKNTDFYVDCGELRRRLAELHTA